MKITKSNGNFFSNQAPEGIHETLLLDVNVLPHVCPYHLFLLFSVSVNSDPASNASGIRS